MSAQSTPTTPLASPPAARTLASRLASAARRLTWTELAGGAWATLALSAWLHPDARGFGTHQQLGLPPCTFTALTGIPCPGCGLTTSFAHMAHAHPIAAFRAHLMGPALFAIVLVFAFYGPYAAAKAKPVRTLFDAKPAFPALMITACAGLLTFALRVAHIL